MDGTDQGFEVLVGSGSKVLAGRTLERALEVAAEIEGKHGQRVVLISHGGRIIFEGAELREALTRVLRSNT